MTINKDESSNSSIALAINYSYSKKLSKFLTDPIPYDFFATNRLSS